MYLASQKDSIVLLEGRAMLPHAVEAIAPIGVANADCRQAESV
jgi:hypothetical protein